VYIAWQMVEVLKNLDKPNQNSWFFTFAALSLILSSSVANVS